MVKQFLERIAQFTPSQLLSTTQANNMYQYSPSKREKLIGITKMMKKTFIDSDVIKYSAIEPTSGLMRSVGIGVKAPIIPKRESSTERQISVYFKDSVQFTSKELLVIAQASKSTSNDAQIAIARKSIITAIEQLKNRSTMGDEKLFWDGCTGTMSVLELNNGTKTTRSISTNTRTIAALTSTATWDYAAATSTADVPKNVKTMQQSFTGKGSALKQIYMNLVTFHAATATANALTGLRALYKYTTRDLEEKGLSDAGLLISGVPLKVYNETYLDDAKASQNFIADGTIIGFGESDSISDGLVEHANGLNVDAEMYGNRNPAGDVKTVYGSFLEAIAEKNPTSVTIVHTKNALPIFKMPQLIVSQSVFT